MKKLTLKSIETIIPQGKLSDIIAQYQCWIKQYGNNVKIYITPFNGTNKNATIFYECEEDVK